MAKKIRFPLEMENGVEVRSVEELKENFSLAQVLMYISNGKLVTWLRDRYADDIADVIEAQDINDSDLSKKICSIFDVEYDEEVAIDIEKLEERNRKLKLLKTYTSEQNFLDCVDQVAFTQDDLYDLLDEDITNIYLCGESFSIPLSKCGISYKGINNPVIVVASKTPVDWSEKNIKITDIRFDKEYQLVIGGKSEEEGAENLYLQCKFDDAFIVFEKLAHNANARAMYFLGEIYNHGFGHTVKNSDEGNLWRKKGADMGDVLAGINTAYSYPENSTKRNQIFEKYFSSVCDLAQSGDIFAQNELADLYFGGFGIPINNSVGLEWLKKSAESGFWRSYCKMGDLYYYGNIVQQDYTTALNYYKLGAKDGYDVAELNVAYCYYYGKGVAEDNSEALKWFEKSYEHGNGEAANMIGFMYFKGYGVTEDSSKEFTWMKRSAELGYVQGQSNLGNCYYYGRGTTKDIDEAKKWYVKAGEAGNDYATTQVGIIEKEQGNYIQAVKWFKLAAERGYSDAQNRLGVRYANGEGVEKNSAQEIYWYMQAAAQGHEKALENIKYFYALDDNSTVLTIVDGKVYYCYKHTEDFYKRYTDIYEIDGDGNKNALYSDRCDSNFDTSVSAIHKESVVVIAISSNDNNTILKIVDDSVEVIDKWPYTFGEPTYIKFEGDYLEYGQTNILGNKQRRKKINI